MTGHGFAFSRRHASELCQSLARTARGDGAVGGARAPTGTPEAGLTYPPRTARHRARPRLGAAPPSAPPTTGAVDRSGAPRSGQLSLCPLKGSLLESGPSSNRTGAIISPPWGAWIRNVKNFFRQHLQLRRADQRLPVATAWVPE